jgi:hypothetical protein
MDQNGLSFSMLAFASHICLSKLKSSSSSDTGGLENSVFISENKFSTDSFTVCIGSSEHVSGDSVS